MRMLPSKDTLKNINFEWLNLKTEYPLLQRLAAFVYNWRKCICIVIVIAFVYNCPKLTNPKDSDIKFQADPGALVHPLKDSDIKIQEDPDALVDPSTDQSVENAQLAFATATPTLFTEPSNSLGIPREQCLSTIEDKHFQDTNFRDRFRGVQIYPRSKLIICIPAKAGSSLDREIRSDLNNVLPETKKIIPWTQDEITEKNELKSYYFCNESWTKIFIVRDPLSRLLSGYLDKCTENVYPYTRIHNGDSYMLHCLEFLNSIDIHPRWLMKHPEKYEEDPDKYRRGNQSNTVGAFVHYLDEKSKLSSRSIDDHFSGLRVYGGLHYDDELVAGWNVYNLKEKRAWDWIYKHQIGDKSLMEHWYKVRNERHLDPDAHDAVAKTVHSSGADNKLLKHYSDSQILFEAMRYTWRDYHLFDIPIPDWICDMVPGRVRDLLTQRFKGDKRLLLPDCV